MNSEKRKRILISGYYGDGNTGDEAILFSIAEQLKGHDLIVVSLASEYTKRVQGLDAVDFFNIDEIEETVKGCDMVIMGGGGLFQEFPNIEYYETKVSQFLNNPYGKPHGKLMAYAIVPIMAAIYKKPLIFLAHGIGPFYTENAKSFYGFILSQSSLITVRDHYSLEWVNKLCEEKPVHLSADPVFLLNPKNEEKVSHLLRKYNLTEKGFIALSLRDLLYHRLTQNTIKEVSRFLNHFLKYNELSVLFIPFQDIKKADYPTQDKKIASQLIDNIDSALKERILILEDYLQPHEIHALMGKCLFGIGMRYHFLIFSFLNNIPAISISYAEKCNNLMREIGLEDLSINIFDINYSTLQSKINKVLNHIDEYKKIITDNLSVMRKRALHTFTLINQFDTTEYDIGDIKESEVKETLDDFDELRKLMLYKDERIRDLKEEMNSRLLDKDIKLNETIAEKDALSGQLNEAIAEKDALSSQLNEAIAEKDALESQLNETIAEKDALSSQLNEAIAEKDALSSQLNEAIAEKDALSSQLNEAIAEKDALSSQLSQAIAEKDALESQLNETIAEKDALKSQLNEKDHEVSFYKNQFKAVESNLNAILTSKTWRLGQFYGKLFYHTKINKIVEALINKLSPRKNNFQLSIDEDVSKDDAITKLEDIVSVINSRKKQGVFIVTSAFEFDEFYNQRVINLSKFLSQNDYSVIYIAWRWSKNDQMSGLCEEVYPDIFQVPVDYLFDHYDIFTKIIHFKKYFILEFSHPKFFTVMMHLNKAGFKALYDIIDDWEEFNRVNQAPWFEKDYEEAIVINADVLTAVSSPLIGKFSHLRTDITLIPNGFSPAFIGGKENISGENTDNGNTINIGYFGHLTDSWFDWDVVIATAERSKDFIFHIIGYGESEEVKSKITKYKNIRLYGKVQPSELYRYAKDWDVAILPFKKTPLSKAVDPIKIYEYLFFGLPVVVQGIDHLNSLPYVRNCKGLNEFQDSIRDFAEKKRNNSISYEEIEEILGECSWEKRFTSMLALLEEDLI